MKLSTASYILTGTLVTAEVLRHIYSKKTRNSIAWQGASAALITWSFVGAFTSQRIEELYDKLKNAGYTDSQILALFEGRNPNVRLGS